MQWRAAEYMRSLRRPRDLGRERLLRYVLRPAVAQERIQKTAEGLVRITLKKAWSDGTVSHGALRRRGGQREPAALACGANSAEHQARKGGEGDRRRAQA